MVRVQAQQSAVFGGWEDTRLQQGLWKPLLAIAVALIATAGMFSDRPIRRAPGVLVDHEPEQTAVTQAPFRFDTFEIAPQADYEIDARVLSVERYRFDAGARLSPVDFAVGWGPMSDSTVLKHFRVTQGVRFFTIYPDEEAIDLGLALHSSANMHLVPADGSIRSQLLSVRAGNLVHLTGYLIDVYGDDGFTWNSSLTRDDTGNGACELLWVTSVSTR